MRETKEAQKRRQRIVQSKKYIRKRIKILRGIYKYNYDDRYRHKGATKARFKEQISERIA